MPINKRIKVQPPHTAQSEHAYLAQLLLECVLALLFVLFVCSVVMALSTLMPKDF